MIDHTAVHLALRSRALSLVVATTGVTSLSATATGYARPAGSFVADAFLVGMEVTPASFGVNTPRIITGVSALAVSTYPAPAAEAEAPGRSLVVGLPALRAFENVPFTPIAGRPYVSEEYVPATDELLTFPAQGALGLETGLYIVTIYGVTAVGSIPGVGISAIRKSVDALKLLFAPGTKITVGSTTVRVRTDTSTQTGQIIPLAGWSALQLKIPWRAESTNLVAA